MSQNHASLVESH